MPITKRDVDALETGSILWDQGKGCVTGFGVRRQKLFKVFILKYRADGKSNWRVIGQYGSPWTVDSARNEARRLLGVVAGGGVIASKARAVLPAPAVMTVAALCTEYMVAAEAGTILTRFKRPKKASTLTIDKGRIKRHIVPLIGHLPPAEVDRKAVRSMIAAIVKGETAIDEKTQLRGRAIVTGGQTAASRVADLLSGIMAYAVEQGYIEVNPVHGVARYRAEPRQRFLSDAELSALGNVLRGKVDGVFHPHALAIVELLCMTGCRLSEVAGLQWQEVDSTDYCLRLRDSKTGGNMRPVGEAAIAKLRALPRYAQSAYVFPAASGEGAYQGTKREIKKIFGAAGIDAASSHTLRHTFASTASGLGYSDATIGGLLGHAGRGVTSRYVHRPDDALKSAATAVAGKIASILGHAPSS